MEYFELSFYGNEKICEARTYAVMEQIVKSNIIATKCRKSNIEIIEEESDTNFFEILVALGDLQISESNYHELVNYVNNFVKIVFDTFNEIKLCLCVYELTGYYIDNVNSYLELNEKLFDKFPLVFCKKNEGFGFYKSNNILFETEHYFCIYNKNTQNLFSE